MKKILTMVALSLALAASIFWLAVPGYTVGDWRGHHHTRTLLQEQGPSALIGLSFPVLITLLPLMFPKPAVWIASTIVLAGFHILSSPPIGLFYMPAAVVLLLATCVGS